MRRDRRVWDDDHSHGRRRCRAIGWNRPRRWVCSIAAPERIDDWADRVVFFDIETTGLSGGAGTLAFLVGCGWFEDEGFRVRQFFLLVRRGERAMLDALDGVSSTTRRCSSPTTAGRSTCR